TMLRPAPSADRRGAGRAWRGMREARGRRQDRAMTEHDVRPSPAPAAHAPAALRPAAQPYHRASRTLAHRRYWWRPLVTLAVSAAVFVGLTMQVMVPLFVLGEVWPAAVTSSSLTDPLNPADQFLGLACQRCWSPPCWWGHSPAMGEPGSPCRCGAGSGGG